MLENLTVERKRYNKVGKFKPVKVGNFTPVLTGWFDSAIPSDKIRFSASKMISLRVGILSFNFIIGDKYFNV